jgi:glycosyltransferase involved in cell wall biosynthesis
MKKEKQITVVMHTNGAHPKYIGAAVRSVLVQTYRDFTLLINNSHASCSIVLDKVYDNVRIINKPHKDFITHMASSFEYVDTPYWCVVDSDDFVMPNHLEQLMELRKIADNFNSEKPINCVGTSMIMKTVERVPEKLIRAGWVRFLYNRINPQIIKELAQNHKRPCGFDQAIDTLSVWNRKIAPDSFAPTYLYRRKEADHVCDRKRYLKVRREITDIPIITPKSFGCDYSKFKNSVNHLPKGAPVDEQTK